jgi:outer membrane protein OmpA-like peptidoglycan-associated protein/tetratricopeptide (TPR) repeat protein
MPKTLSNIKSNISFAALIFTLLSTSFVYAQSARSIEKRADNSFKDKNYYNAAMLYSAILYNSPIGETNLSVVYPVQKYSPKTIHTINETNKNRVIYKLAESYRLYNHYKEAATQYKLYINSKDAQFPEAELWYGYCLLSNDDPQKALQTFNAYLKKHRTNDAFFNKAQQGIASCNLILASKSEKPLALITKLQTTVSEDGSNFAYDKVNDSTFWFTSSRHEMDKKQNKIYPLRLYSSTLYSKNVTKIFEQVASNINMAASSFSSDGNIVFFTGWKEDPKLSTQSFAIYYMIKAVGSSKWSNPIILPSPVNIRGYQSKQPFITNDGKYLLFVSNQPGGLGKFDIWSIAMDGVKPIGNAVNLGANINTQGNEVTPFYNSTDATLWFSTDSRLGMGGMDIYETKGSLVKNTWVDSVIHLGIPFNSVKDDQYFKPYGNADTSYLSSDRFSSCCLEIFRTVKIKKSDSTIDKVSTNIPTEKPSITKVEPIISAEDNIAKSENHLIDSINAITYIRRNVYYNFASSKVRNEDFSQLDDIVGVLNKNSDLNILIASFTDCKGSQEANIRLSRKRSESVRWYLMSKGISTSRINIDFFGKEHFVLQCKEDTTYHTNHQLANRRSDLIITKSQKPKWIPSGRELDISKISIDSNYHSPEFYAITKKWNIANEQVAPAPLPFTEVKSKSAYTRKAVPVNQVREKKENTMEKLPGITFNYSQKKYMAPIPNKLPMNEMLDMTPRLKESTLIDEMTKRVPRKPVEVYSTSDSVRIDLYDNGVFDYDTVSVIFDKHISVYKELLQVDKPISFYVKLNGEQSKNEMIFFAENLGLTPPNSALMVITDAENKRTEVSVSSDLSHNVVIYFIKLNKGKRKEN